MIEWMPNSDGSFYSKGAGVMLKYDTEIDEPNAIQRGMRAVQDVADHPATQFIARVAIYAVFAFVLFGFIGDVFVIYDLHRRSISEWFWSITAAHPLISVFAAPVFIGWGYLARGSWVAVGLVFATYSHLFTVMIAL